MPHHKQLKYAVEHNKAFADMYTRYQVAVTKAEKLLKLPLLYLCCQC